MKTSRPFAVQIFGGQPGRMPHAAEMAEEIGRRHTGCELRVSRAESSEAWGRLGIAQGSWTPGRDSLTEIKKAITIR